MITHIQPCACSRDLIVSTYYEITIYTLHFSHMHTDNKKLEKVAATKKIRFLHGARVLIGEQDKVQEEQVSSGVVWCDGV